jgi:putative ABC transport system substrate-binding protein
MFDILPRNPLIPDIILARSTPATVALQRETRTIPIVFDGVPDPVARGIVPRLNQISAFRRE